MLHALAFLATRTSIMYCQRLVTTGSPPAGPIAGCQCPLAGEAGRACASGRSIVVASRGAAFQVPSRRTQPTLLAAVDPLPPPGPPTSEGPGAHWHCRLGVQTPNRTLNRRTRRTADSDDAPGPGRRRTCHCCQCPLALAGASGTGARLTASDLRSLSRRGPGLTCVLPVPACQWA